MVCTGPDPFCAARDAGRAKVETELVGAVVAATGLPPPSQAWAEASIAHADGGCALALVAYGCVDGVAAATLPLLLGSTLLPDAATPLAANAGNAGDCRVCS